MSAALADPTTVAASGLRSSRKAFLFARCIFSIAQPGAEVNARFA